MKVTQRKIEKIGTLTYNWLTLDSAEGGMPDSCGCEEAQQYPPERSIEIGDYGWIKRIVFVHQNDPLRKICCAVLISKSKGNAESGPWHPMTADEYRRHYEIGRGQPNE
jgi:hypothetical protein